MNRFRLTPVAKVLCLLIVVAIIGTGVFFGFKNGVIKNDLVENETSSSSTSQSSTNTVNTIAGSPADSDAINLSLDEWIG